jgi:hypothetical protein
MEWLNEPVSSNVKFFLDLLIIVVALGLIWIDPLKYIKKK